jgi:1,2-dihydroxy-3-keto-5-methylthiopentene dioxygenase
MAVVTVPDENLVLRETEEVTKYLAGIGLTYERWTPRHALAPDAQPQDILAAYAAEIERLKEVGGYVTADVIDINPETPGLEEMLSKFKREHWHDEDEVRFIIEGRGVFHIRPQHGSVVSIEVQAGDLLSVPSGTWHWFNLCSDLRIKAIRLFSESKGWLPFYTESMVDGRYQPMCFGASYLTPSNA